MIIAWIARRKLELQLGNGLIGTLMIGFVAASTAQKYMNDAGIHVSVIVLVPLLVATIWGTGWLSIKVGLYRAENKYTWDNVPQAQHLFKGKK